MMTNRRATLYMLGLTLLGLALLALTAPAVGAQFRPSPAGAGSTEIVTSTDPAANTEISVTVPARQAWRVLSFSASLVTDANAANREVAVTFSNGTVFMRQPSRTNQAASLTRLYSFFQGAVSFAVATDTTLNAPLPFEVILPAAFIVATVTTNRQATDNWGPATLLIERYQR